MLVLCGLGSAESAWWPEACGDFSDEVLFREGAEKSGVVGVRPVVSHDEDVVLGHDNRAEGIDTRYFAGGGALLGGQEVGFVRWLAVYQQDAFLYRDLFSRKAHDPFYDLFVLTLVDALEDHEIPLIRVREIVDKLVCQDVVSRLQSWGHALGRDAHRLHDEGADETEDQIYGHDQHHEERPGTPLLPGGPFSLPCARREPAVEALANLLTLRGPVLPGDLSFPGACRKTFVKALVTHGGRGYRTYAGTLRTVGKSSRP